MTVENILSRPQLQIEDREFDAWCDKITGVLKKAGEDFKK
jgi:hypothetical protein